MTAELVNKRLGDFAIVRELGRGGMGVVYEAMQLSLNRRVALKVLGPGLGLTPKTVDRFHREAESAARLHHTNIVPVYATGEADGYHFYAMELILGPPLDRVIRDLANSADADKPPAQTLTLDAPHSPRTLALTGPYVEPSVLTPAAPGAGAGLSSGGAYFDTVARMMADAADALHYAHEQGVIHRDIKPSNLLLSTNGRVNVTDFGLARLLEQHGMTLTGEFVGTPAYVAPEQIASGRVPVDQRCDIYSLGATLYELLTLRPPFAAASRDSLLAMVLQKEPAPPRSVNPRVPGDLETICLKCLEKDPDRRYTTAKELADDLRCYVSRFAIRARRTGPLGKLRKWMKRNPALTAALLVVLLAVVAGGTFAYRAHLAEKVIAKERLRLEEQQREQERKKALTETLDRAVLAVMSGRDMEVEQALDEAIELGASAGQIRLIRGQLELQQGHTAKALEHLEAAVRQLPDSPAAQALLTQAYFDAGHMDLFYSRMAQLSRMVPRDADDYLYLGQVTAYHYPADGLPLLNRAIRLRDTPLARLIRAQVRAYFAQDLGAPLDADQAAEDAQEALDRLPGNPLALAVSLEAHLSAAVVYAIHGLTEKKRAALDQAARRADQLRPFTAFPRGIRARGYYLAYVGDRAGIRDAYLREQETAGTAYTARPYFYQLYGDGEFEKALRVLDRMPAAGNEMMYHVRRGFILANRVPGGVDKAYEAYRGAVKAGQGTTRGELYSPMLLLFLGRKDEATLAYRKIAEEGRRDVDGGRLPADPTRWYQKLREYVGGLRSAEELLVAAGSSRWHQCEGHYFIGLNLLAGGDREGAKVHFQKCRDTGIYHYLEYEWSGSLLARMAADRRWPPWIPSKK